MFYKVVNGENKKFYEYDYWVLCMDSERQYYQINVLAKDMKEVKQKIIDGLYNVSINLGTNHFKSI
jgi:hypothetical protein